VGDLRKWVDENTSFVEDRWKDYVWDQVFNSDEAYFRLEGDERCFWEFAANLKDSVEG
jgi:hypothetical protein